MTYTEEQVERLVDAMWQLIDDMGPTGLSVCHMAKAQARIALEPFLDDEDKTYTSWLSLFDAKQIVKSVD